MWVGTMLLILEFQFTVFINEIFQQPDCVCFRFLHISQSVCAVVCIIRSNLLYFLALFLVVLSRLLLLIPKQVKYSNYQVSMHMADNAVDIVFLHCSSVIIMCCELSFTHTFGKQSQPIPGHQNTKLKCVCVHTCVCVCSAVI